MEATSKRPLPPLPADLSPECSSSAPTSDPVSPVKSIFEGASKYEILNYLEDARERGLTDCDLELDSEITELALQEHQRRQARNFNSAIRKRL